MEKLSQKNQEDFERKNTDDKITYPFVLIKQSSDASFLIKQDDIKNSRLCILSDKELHLIDADYICRILLMKE